MVPAGLIPLTTVDIAYKEPALPVRNVFGLGQNRPNPFNPQTTIQWELPARSHFTLVIYDAAGRRVRQFEGVAAAGLTSLTWDGTDELGEHVSSGVFYYKLQAGEHAAQRKMVLIK